ncbi:hypothetical protein F66182_8375 [Fusarium sp. NRRL 66182]|nr:hypothetical protein F66182_8375 [Fusarium sp. NRRL 66182]
MDSNRVIIKNFHKVVGFTETLDLQSLNGLGQIQQNRLEEKLTSASKKLSVKNMASIYIRWLAQQTSLLDRNPRRQVVERWVVYVDTWGLTCDKAISMWTDTMQKRVVDWPAENWSAKKQRRLGKSIRQELEFQFSRVSHTSTRPNPSPVWTLKNWPTRDIPFPSIELDGDEGTDDSEDSEDEPIDKSRACTMRRRLEKTPELIENSQQPEMRT